jgi:putative ABC transport system permease protein
VQFLVEAVTLSFIGGIIGLGAGLSVIQLLTNAFGWSMTLPLSAVVVAVGTSATIGIVFGFFPARRAARMDPITALRHE